MAGLSLSITRVDGTNIKGTYAKSIDLGIITEINVIYTVSGNPSPNLIWGWRGAFMMDMGVSKSIRLNFTRVSPPNPDNNSSDSTRWTNAYWRTVFKEELSEWQAKHFAYKLHIVPSDAELFPEINDTGYMTSFSCPINANNIYALSGSLDFSVGRIKQDGS